VTVLFISDAHATSEFTAANGWLRMGVFTSVKFATNFPVMSVGISDATQPAVFFANRDDLCRAGCDCTREKCIRIGDREESGGIAADTAAIGEGGSLYHMLCSRQADEGRFSYCNDRSLVTAQEGLSRGTPLLRTGRAIMGARARKPAPTLIVPLA